MLLAGAQTITQTHAIPVSGVLDVKCFMKVFLKVLMWIGITVLMLFAFGIGNILLQTKHAKNLCSSYKVGDQMPSIEKLDSEYLLHPVGPFELKERPGFDHVIFCASATWCEVSCQITFKDEKISEVEYESH